MSRKWFQETVAELIGSAECPTGRKKIKSTPNNEGQKQEKNNNNKSKHSLNSKIFSVNSDLLIFLNLPKPFQSQIKR